MRIILLRHSSTNHSETNYIADDKLDLPLSRKGILEAKKIKKEFQALIKPDVIYVSTMKRTDEMAKIFFPNSQRIIVQKSQFNEIDKGFDNYLDINPAKAKMRTWEWEERYNNSPNLSKRSEYLYPSGQTIALMRKKVIDEFKKIIKSKYKNILIISHNGPIKSIITYILGNDDKIYFNLNILPNKYSEIIKDSNHAFKLLKLNAG